MTEPKMEKSGIEKVLTEDITYSGENPGETLDERYDELVKGYVTEENMKAFIAKEIKSAVEAERRRISEEAKMYRVDRLPLYDKKSYIGLTLEDHLNLVVNRVNQLIDIINTKK